MLLSLTFLFLSFDEVLALHEKYGQVIGDYMLGKQKVIYFSWVVPYAILATVFALLFIRFWLTLPFKTRILFMIACVIYVGGAIGMELMGGMIVKHIHSEGLPYAISECLEETMEMGGVILFIYVLLDYITKNNLKFVLVSANK